MTKALSAKSGVVFTIATALVAAAGTWAIAVGSALAPEPAKATAPLTGTIGSTCGAIFFKVEPVVTVVKWSNSYNYCGYPGIPAGTPCANIDLLSDEVTDKQIQRLGSKCRCVRPNVPSSSIKTTVLTSPMGGGSPGTGVSATVKPTIVIKWPLEYHVEHPLPEPGTPCSPVDLPTGAPINRHIQQFQEGSGWHRCVSINLPIRAQ